MQINSLRFALFAALLTAPTTSAVAHEKIVADSLGIRDLLDIGNASIQDLSPDGKWLAVTMSTRRDGLGTDYFRDNDPTYLRAPQATLVIIDTKTGTRRNVFPMKK